MIRKQAPMNQLSGMSSPFPSGLHLSWRSCPCNCFCREWGANCNKVFVPALPGLAAQVSADFLRLSLIFVTQGNECFPLSNNAVGDKVMPDVRIKLLIAQFLLSKVFLWMTNYTTSIVCTSLRKLSGPQRLCPYCYSCIKPYTCMQRFCPKHALCSWLEEHPESAVF